MLAPIHIAVLWVVKLSDVMCPPSHHQVISAQQLPKVNNKKSSIVDAVVRVEVYGVPADVAQEETHHVENNGTFRFDMFHLAKCKSHDASAFGSTFRIVVERVCTGRSLSRPECNAATAHFRKTK